MDSLELNTLVATEVMQYKKQTFKGLEGFGTHDGLIFHSHFSPSVDIMHAWRVIEKLKENNISFQIKSSKTGFVVEFSHHNLDIHSKYESDKVEVAICKSALEIQRKLNIEGGTPRQWTTQLAGIN